MSLRDMYNILKNAEPVFNYGVTYGTLDESVKIIDDLLRHQHSDDQEEISRFLTAVVDIIDKRIPKCNTLVVISPPSAGKNFFFDMIFSICVNYGQLGQANRHNLFAFQEAPNKRVLVWNEPNYESSLTDTIKMMTAGDPFTVRVKNKPDMHVRRTPLIVMTNVQVDFMYDHAFVDRLIKFRWTPAPFLKECEFKPYPMAFFEILNKYNIEY